VVDDVVRAHTHADADAGAHAAELVEADRFRGFVRHGWRGLVWLPVCSSEEIATDACALDVGRAAGVVHRAAGVAAGGECRALQHGFHRLCQQLGLLLLLVGVARSLFQTLFLGALRVATGVLRGSLGLLGARFVLRCTLLGSALRLGSKRLYCARVGSSGGNARGCGGCSCSCDGQRRRRRQGIRRVQL